MFDKVTVMFYSSCTMFFNVLKIIHKARMMFYNSSMENKKEKANTPIPASKVSLYLKITDT